MSSTSSVRRLSNDDVKTIFDCVFNNKLPKNKRLMFNIIVVGPQCMKLSPPSYEFEDGLYILLKPLKRTKHGRTSNYTKNPSDDPRIPSNLKKLVFLGTPKETCPWSLSGPQFPVPTSIQQRYCYPKGDPEYSHTKGGALWTVYDDHGKEDLEYRLLHVYFSAKRAGNSRKPCSTTYNTTTVTTKRRRESRNHQPLHPSSKPFGIEAESFSSASFDSPLSFNMPPVSPVDLSIFRNVFPNLSSATDSTEQKDEGEEPVITPDRSVLEQGATRSTANESYQNDSTRYPPTVQSKNHQQTHAETTMTTNSAHSPHSSHGKMIAYPMYHNNPHYYPPPYSHWQPVPYRTHYNQESCHTSSYRTHHPLLPPTSSNSAQQYSFPVQQERRSVKNISNTYLDELTNYLDSIRTYLHEKLKATPDLYEREQLSTIISKWAKSLTKTFALDDNVAVTQQTPSKDDNTDVGNNNNVQDGEEEEEFIAV